MINTREITAEYRLSHWAQVMRDKINSGLSVKAYCESIGIHQNTYFYWQRKLCKAAVITAADTKTHTVPKGWALCKPATVQAKKNSIEIEIGKSRIKVYADTDRELLAEICRTLVAIC